MRKLLLATAIFITCFTCKLYAQPQWKFHIAFEDATGAKDTILLIWDSTATYPGVDTLLGEGKANFDYSQFNVWIYNDNNDSTKTSAVSWNDYPINLAYVHAFNFQYPITVRWDTALFHSSFFPSQQNILNSANIDNDYFFFINNSPITHNFDMLIADSAYAPAFNWFSQSQFPMIFHLTYEPTGIAEIKKNNQIIIYPTLVTNEF